MISIMTSLEQGLESRPILIKAVGTKVSLYGRLPIKLPAGSCADHVIAVPMLIWDGSVKSQLLTEMIANLSKMKKIAILSGGVKGL
jgi:hypothetical protein